MHISKILLPGLLDKEGEILSTLLHIEDAFEHSQSVSIHCDIFVSIGILGHLRTFYPATPCLLMPEKFDLVFLRSEAMKKEQE